MGDEDDSEDDEFSGPAVCSLFMTALSTIVHRWCAIVGNHLLVGQKYVVEGGVDPNLAGIRLWSTVSAVAAAAFFCIGYFTCPGGHCGVRPNLVYR